MTALKPHVYGMSCFAMSGQLSTVLEHWHGMAFKKQLSPGKLRGRVYNLYYKRVVSLSEAGPSSTASARCYQLRQRAASPVRLAMGEAHIVEVAPATSSNGKSISSTYRHRSAESELIGPGQTASLFEVHPMASNPCDVQVVS